MPELILHHYERSPFSEKIRLIFGLKGLTWRSVEIPAIMPKADYVALTGGYRRTPSLQIGADIYCDTQRICAELERRHPEPSLYARGGEGLNTALSMWADKVLFWPAVRYTIGINAEAFGAEFHADRAQMRGAEPNIELIKAAAGPLLTQLHPQLAWIEDMLADGREFLLGASPGLADFAVYHCLWFVRNGGQTALQLGPYKRLLAWMDQIAAIGHGEREDMDSASALSVAKAADPAPWSGETFGAGPELGQRVSVASDDNVAEPVVGDLVISTAHEIAVRRHSDQSGDVIVHFPRLGYLVKPA